MKAAAASQLRRLTQPVETRLMRFASVQRLALRLHWRMAKRAGQDPALRDLAAAAWIDALIGTIGLRQVPPHAASRLVKALVEDAADDPAATLVAALAVAGSRELLARLVAALAKAAPDRLAMNVAAAATPVGCAEFRAQLVASLVEHMPETVARQLAEAAGSANTRDAIVAVLVAAAPHELAREAMHRLSEEAPRLLAALISRLPPYDLQQECYAQEGEDLVLMRIFGDKSDGFYVDVGAHHPVRFSNTFLLYRQGWHGINIDATPGSMEEFRKLRPRDINIECLVASTEASMRFYMLNEPALNTVSPELARQRPRENAAYRLEQETVLPARRLDSILDECLPPERTIDLLNVDVEGADLDVLRSSDWTRYRPRYVVVESLAGANREIENGDIAQFLHGHGYRAVAKFFNTSFFKSLS